MKTGRTVQKLNKHIKLAAMFLAVFLCICSVSEVRAKPYDRTVSLREIDSISGNPGQTENGIRKSSSEIGAPQKVFAGIPGRYAAGSHKMDTLVPGGTYIIENAGGSGILNVENSSVYDGTNIYMTHAKKLASEKWVLQDAGNGYCFIRNLKSWKCLDISDGNVQQSTFDAASDTQKWQLLKNSNGSYQIRNAAGLYLNASRSGGRQDAKAFDHAGSDSGSWIFEEINPGNALDMKTDGTQFIGIRRFDVIRGNVIETDSYYNIQTSIELPDKDYEISGGRNYSIGLRVMYVNSFLAYYDYLSWDYYYYNRYDENTAWAVAQFQSDNGLEADGEVDIDTWRTMGFSDEEYYNVDRYITPLKVDAYGSSRQDYINAMIMTAYEYLWADTGYADGAAGPPGTYVDCSGLIYQCLYAAGIDPDTNIVDHARVIYEFGSAYLGYDQKLGEAADFAEPGDLIFYGDGWISHVGIYIGDYTIIDSAGGFGVWYDGIYGPGIIQKIVRIF